jgi:hypothetical protein
VFELRGTVFERARELREVLLRDSRSRPFRGDLPAAGLTAGSILSR